MPLLYSWWKFSNPFTAGTSWLQFSDKPVSSIEVSVTLSACGLIPAAPSCLCGCSYFSSLNPLPPQLLSEMDLEQNLEPQLHLG